MNRISIEDIAKATDGRVIRSRGNGFVEGIFHDSRACGEGDLFLCVKGPNNDGHDYIPQVYEAGCRCVLISNESKLPEDMDVDAILVGDTVEAAGALASWYLDKLEIIRIGVTGSVGKTSTRDMVYYILNEKFKCGRNIKNYNNEIGLPMSIFRLDDSYDAVVLEMGMSDFGEIRKLSKIVKPHIGIITGIGVAHMEHLGSREGIFNAKMEITENLAGSGDSNAGGNDSGTMIFAYDDEFLNRERAGGDYESLFVGEDGRSDLIVTDIEDMGIDGVTFALEYREKREIFRVPVPGRHNALNASLAIGAAYRLGMNADEVGAGLGKVRLTGHRLRVVKAGGITVIDDTYNANPDSMKAGLKVLEKSRCNGKKTAILGDMYELGADEEKLHRGVGVFAAGCGIDQVITIGPLAANIAEGAATGGLVTGVFETKEEFLRDKDMWISPGDLVLVKASRGMKLEEIVEAIEK